MKIFDQSIKTFIKLNKSLTTTSPTIYSTPGQDPDPKFYEDGRYYPFCAEMLCITPTMQLAWYSINV